MMRDDESFDKLVREKLQQRNFKPSNERRAKAEQLINARNAQKQFRFRVSIASGILVLVSGIVLLGNHFFSGKNTAANSPSSIQTIHQPLVSSDTKTDQQTNSNSQDHSLTNAQHNLQKNTATNSSDNNSAINSASGNENLSSDKNKNESLNSGNASTQNKFTDKNNKSASSDLTSKNAATKTDNHSHKKSDDGFANQKLNENKNPQTAISSSQSTLAKNNKSGKNQKKNSDTENATNSIVKNNKSGENQQQNSDSGKSGNSSLQSGTAKNPDAAGNQKQNSDSGNAENSSSQSTVVMNSGVGENQKQNSDSGNTENSSLKSGTVKNTDSAENQKQNSDSGKGTNSSSSVVTNNTAEDQKTAVPEHKGNTAKPTNDSAQAGESNAQIKSKTQHSDSSSLVIQHVPANADSSSTAQTSLNSLNNHPGSVNYFFIEGGMTFVPGFSHGYRSGKSLNPVIGAGFCFRIGMKLGMEVALHYTFIGHASDSSIVYTNTSYRFGAQYEYTDVSLKRLHYLSLPLSLSWHATAKSALTGGLALNYLFTTETRLRTYSATQSNIHSYSKYGYIQGVNRFDVLVMAGYTRTFNSQWSARFSAYYGLMDIKKNSWYGINKFERNKGLQLTVQYAF